MNVWFRNVVYENFLLKLLYLSMNHIVLVPEFWFCIGLANIEFECLPSVWFYTQLDAQLSPILGPWRREASTWTPAYSVVRGQQQARTGSLR